MAHGKGGFGQFDPAHASRLGVGHGDFVFGDAFSHPQMVISSLTSTWNESLAVSSSSCHSSRVICNVRCLFGGGAGSASCLWGGCWDYIG